MDNWEQRRKVGKRMIPREAYMVKILTNAYIVNTYFMHIYYLLMQKLLILRYLGNMNLEIYLFSINEVPFFWIFSSFFKHISRTIDMCIYDKPLTHEYMINHHHMKVS